MRVQYKEKERKRKETEIEKRDNEQWQRAEETKT
jgi:hypothetical protein